MEILHWFSFQWKKKHWLKDPRKSSGLVLGSAFGRRWFSSLLLFDVLYLPEYFFLMNKKERTDGINLKIMQKYLTRNDHIIVQDLVEVLWCSFSINREERKTFPKWGSEFFYVFLENWNSILPVLTFDGKLSFSCSLDEISPAQTYAGVTRVFVWVDLETERWCSDQIMGSTGGRVSDWVPIWSNRTEQSASRLLQVQTNRQALAGMCSSH